MNDTTIWQKVQEHLGRSIAASAMLGIGIIGIRRLTDSAAGADTTQQRSVRVYYAKEIAVLRAGSPYQQGGEATPRGLGYVDIQISVAGRLPAGENEFHLALRVAKQELVKPNSAPPILWHPSPRAVNAKPLDSQYLGKDFPEGYHRFTTFRRLVKRV